MFTFYDLMAVCSTVIALISLVCWLLHKPLPLNMSDKFEVWFIELGMRITMDYPVSLI